MRVFIVKQKIGFISDIYYAWDEPLPDAKEVEMPEFKWKAWKKRQEEFDALQKDMESVYENA